jgi:broad specificity phosphatase PhoE
MNSLNQPYFKNSASKSSIVKALPPSNVKEVYFIRHGQAEHNLARLNTPSHINVYLDEKYTDASLTSIGKKQAETIPSQMNIKVLQYRVLSDPISN